MGKNLLFVNVSKNADIIMLHNAEAERYGHKVFNITDFHRPVFNQLDAVEYIDPPNTTLYQERIQNIVKTCEIDYVLTQCEVLAPLIDEVKRFNPHVKILPTMDIPTNQITDKVLFGEFCKLHGLAHPDFLVPKSIDELSNTFDRAIFMKPTNGTHGTILLFRSKDKYSQFDYRRYESPEALINLMTKHGAIDDFLNTQLHGKELPIGKGLGGIVGRHVIQECVHADYIFVINALIADDTIHFSVISKTDKSSISDSMSIYMHDESYVEQLVVEKGLDQYKQISDFMGEHAFVNLMQQLDLLIKGAGIKLANMNLMLVPYKNNSYYIQDIQLRHGGQVSRVIRVDEEKKADPIYGRIKFSEIDYDSIWEYI